MWPIRTTISSRKQLYSQLTDLKSGLLKSWKLWPYSMHYWYFNIIDPGTKHNYSYILARSNAEITLNGKRVSPRPGIYTGVLVDFYGEHMEVFEQPVRVEGDTLCGDDFYFGIHDNHARIGFKGHEFTFDKVLSDSYWANFYGLYDWYNLNASRDNAYLCVNNVIARGPMVPWNWLHFYFEDGTYVKVFSALAQKKTLRLNDEYFQLDRIEENAQTIAYHATQGDCYFDLVLRKSYRAPLNYKPRLSPAWQYDQLNILLESVKTNIPGFNTQQQGSGILELTSGFSF